jgi:uncharacterized DUF497 family protein
VGCNSNGISERPHPNLLKHGVSFQEAATVFGEALGRIVTDPRHSSEEELVLLGISQDKRLLGAMFRRARRGNSNHSAEERREASANTMKKTRSKENVKRQASADEIPPEYDFSNASRNKFASRYTAGSSKACGTADHSSTPVRLRPWTTGSTETPSRGLRAFRLPRTWRESVPGHPFGLSLKAEDKRALIAFLRTI